MSYFPESYFGGTSLGYAPTGDSVIVQDPALTDAGCLAWIKEQLDGSGLFAWTGIGRITTLQTNGEYPSAWIYPVGYQEIDDVDPEVMTRKFSFVILVLTAADDPGQDVENIQQLDDISRSVAELLEQGPPGAIQGLSRIEAGKYDVIPIGTTARPAVGTQTSGIYLQGSIAYLIDRSAPS